MSETTPIQINMLVGDMGSGKTKTVIEYIKAHPDELILYLSPSHQSLYDVGVALMKERIEFAHWEGFTRLCPEFLSGNKDIEILHPVFNLAKVCAFCNRKGWMKPQNCPFRTQFDTEAKVILAPLSYINTKVVIGREWDHIFVDDVDVYYSTPLKPLTEMNKDWDFLTFIFFGQKQLDNQPKFDSTNPEEFIVQFREIDRRSHIYYHNIIENKGDLRDWIPVSILLNPNGFEFYYWNLFLQINRKKEHISYFNLNDLFNLVAENPETKATIVGMQTPARAQTIRKVAARFELEYGTKIMFREYEPILWDDAPKMGSLYRICVEGRYPRVSLIKYLSARRNVANGIALAVKKEERKQKRNLTKFGVILSLALLEKGESWIQQEFFSKIQVDEVSFLTFGKLRSSNRFIDVDMVIILGTYVVNHEALIEEYNRTSTKKDMIPSLNYTIKDEFQGYIYKSHPDLEILRRLKEVDEMAQAIGRGVFRGIPTAVAGVVPDYIKEKCASVYEEISAIKEAKVVWQEPILEYFDKTGISELELKEARTLLINAGYKITKNITRFREVVERHFDSFEIISDSKGEARRPRLFLVKRKRERKKS